MSGKYKITCGNCGESWYPNPNMWKNIDRLLRDGRKTLFCPYCGNRILLRAEDVKELTGVGYNDRNLHKRKH